MNAIVPFGKGVRFFSHKNHNPDCDIMVGQIDDDTSLSYGVYVKGPRTGQEFCEYYSGENYNILSRKRSCSRMWYADKMPIKYRKLWEVLRSNYQALPK